MFDGGGCSAPIFCVLGPLLLSNFQPRIDPMVGSAYSMSVRRQKAEGERQKAEGKRQKAEGRRQKAERRFRLTSGRWVTSAVCYSVFIPNA